MRSAIGIAAAAWLVATACGSGNGTTTPQPSPDPPRADQQTTPVPDPTPAPPPTPAIPPGPPPDVRIQLTQDGDGASIEVTNLGTEVVRLRPRLTLERESSGSWSATDPPAGILLRWDCQTAPPTDCLTLAPGAGWIPPDWLGTLGDSQCACNECAPAPAGRYRLVAQSCDGSTRIEGTPLTFAR